MPRANGHGALNSRNLSTCLKSAHGTSIVVEVNYNVELVAIPDDYLVRHVSQAIDRRSSTPWIDEVATGRTSDRWNGISRAEC